MVIPFLYSPRSYQLPFWKYMRERRPHTRAFLVWHRRAGKDKTTWNWLIEDAITGPTPGTYFYFAPTYAQGKKILWDGLDNEGLPFLAHIPPDLILGRNETEMQLHVQHISGAVSIIQIIGTDNVDSVRGTNPRGCVFSEYAYQNPRAWDTVEPILLANGGWAVFVTTPNGKNHAYKLWEYAQRHPAEWFTSILTVRDTRDDRGAPVIDERHIERLRGRGVTEETIQREYYCSFTGSVEGAYYARLLDAAFNQGRVGEVPHDARYRVETWWDLGVGDQTAIWFVQRARGRIHVIDYHEAHGEGLPYYASLLQQRQRERGYVYSRHVMPHDIAVRDFSTGMSRYQTAIRLGIRPIKVSVKLPIDEGIQAVRMLLPVCYFDARRCEQGLNALQSYKKVFDDDLQTFKNQPLHDWASHAADAFRTGAVAANAPDEDEPVTPIRTEMHFDPYTYDEHI